MQSVHITREAPEVSALFTKALARLGGLNRFGAPYWRVVWGGTATKFLLGDTRLKYPTRIEKSVHHWEEVTTDEHGGVQVLRTFPAGTTDTVKSDYLLRPVFQIVEEGDPFWMLEYWHAPERCLPGWNLKRYVWKHGDRYSVMPPPAYDAHLWERVDALGDPPLRGQYRLHKKLCTPEGKFLPLDQNVLEYVVRIIAAYAQDNDGTSPDLPMSDRMLDRLAIEDRDLDERKEQAEYAREIAFRENVIAPHIHRLYTLHPNEGRGW